MRTGAVDITELDPLEQADFIAYEQRELEIRFSEQAALMFALSRTEEDAKARIAALRKVYWPEAADVTDARDRLDTGALLEMQDKTFKLVQTGRGAMLEIGTDE